MNVYTSDACLMQTFEVIYDLKDSAEYVAGSQETTPGSGYNYEVFLKALAAKLDKFARLAAASPADMKLYHDRKFGLRSFDDEDARDLYQLMKLYFDNSQAPGVKEAAKDVIVFLSEKLVLRNDAPGYKSKDANGASIYFPVFYMNTFISP